MEQGRSSGRVPRSEEGSGTDGQELPHPAVQTAQSRTPLGRVGDGETRTGRSGIERRRSGPGLQWLGFCSGPAAANQVAGTGVGRMPRSTGSGSEGVDQSPVAVEER